MTSFDLSRIGAGLPVAEQAESSGLVGALVPGARLVVQAPPGAGKTTYVPALAANALLTGGDARTGRVIVTQPRRVAARAAAHRLAFLAGPAGGDTEPGGPVGYRVRGDTRVSAATRIEFCTTGVLLRRLLAEPDLPGVAAVVLDEVHERQLDSDLVFGMVREIAELRDDLTVIAMSATLAAERFAELLAGPGAPARVVRIDGTLHPLDVDWAPPSGAAPFDARGVTDAFLTHVAETARGALAAWPGNGLVFVPGVREVERVVGLLAGAVPEVAVLPLHGRLAMAQQQAALTADTQRRIVVATSVAESSLTVPGVRIVIDSGLAREPRYDGIRGMTGLVTRTESRASAEQRAGRAAREAPGVAVRCFAAETWSRLAAAPTPEILTADLTRATLDLACWGTPRGEGLTLPDRPPPAALARAEETLRDLGAVAADGRATAEGHRLARVPVDPRLARGLFVGAESLGGPTGARRAAEIVAALEADQRAPGADLAALLRDLRSGRSPGAAGWRTESKRLARLAEVAAVPADMAQPGQEIGLVVAAAYPDRIARRRGGDSRAYLLASGTAADLPPDSTLGRPEWLAVAQVDRQGGHRGSGAIIRAAAVLDEETALTVGLLSERDEVTWVGGRVGAVRVRSLGAIQVSVTPVPVPREAGAAAVRSALVSSGLGLLQWPDAAMALRRRMAFAAEHLGAPWPAVTDAALIERLDEWLGPELIQLAEGAAVRSLDLVAALRRLLPWPQAGTFDELVPERLAVPTGSRIRLAYPEDPADRPVLAVKLQECFGLTDTPVVAGVPVLFHLLSPAGRPLAVTDDLASFWVNAYPGVRAENRGRYAKHPWPEDPLTAPPRRGTTRSGR
ncbi:ATP-dependent helicase HrpB [Granulicoccus sp. GXG6511]|uniref:ATP-dependent helicase HrpB n=1 Tax=Granulicoccus sp. GXG6511 TaxID=3381351 RepID=UPI003D7D3A87